MPLFLTTQTFVPVPLEATYQVAWDPAGRDPRGAGIPGWPGDLGYL